MNVVDDADYKSQSLKVASVSRHDQEMCGASQSPRPFTEKTRLIGSAHIALVPDHAHD